jgi:hypothetical protein
VTIENLHRRERSDVAQEMMYRQCALEKREGKAVIKRVLWGPEKYAVLGKLVKVEEDNGEWSEGWRVVFVSKEVLPERYVRHMSHAYTRQRKASDI